MAILFHAEQHQLSNGIPVILQHYESPVAATYWWVKVGSADEVQAEAGFAHFLEHMLFKDAAAKESGTASTGKMARTIESLGGDINAYTSFDQTVYHVTCAAQHWERILDSFGEMAHPQRFLKEDFEREREVILEELRKNEDSPGRQLFQKLFTATFSKHPYGRPVIGYSKVLKGARLSQLESFYRRHYVPERMGLVLVGPFQDESGERKKSILNILEKRFGKNALAKAPRKKEPSKPRVVEPALREESAWVLKPFDVKSPTLGFSFRVPELAHEDIPALDLLAGILGMGELSRLYQQLFYKTSLATDISGGLYVPRDPGMLYFQVEADSIEKLPQVAEETFRELKRLGEEGPSQEELSRVLVNAESERLYATQTADGMASRLGFLKFVMGDLAFDQQYLEDLRQVDAARIQQVANHYLDYRRMSGVALVPQENSQFDLSEIDAKAKSLLDRSSNGLRAGNTSGDLATSLFLKKASGKDLPTLTTLPSGVQVCFYPRPGSQVFSIHASVLGGVRLEIGHPLENADRDWGVSYMMALTWPKGTHDLTARQISAAVEGSASHLEGFSGRNSVGLQMTGLARDWNRLSQLFTGVLAHPVFPADEVDHARRVAEDAIRSVEDHSSQLCSKLFLETLFQNHPYGRFTYGSLDSVTSLQSEKLKSFHRLWVRPERLVISVSGAVKSGALEAWLLQLESEFKSIAGSAGSASLPRHLDPEPSLKAPRWVDRNLGREQCHILVGGLGTQIDAEDRHTLRLLQTILGGQSGRLFIELREKKSLAYTVAPVSFEGLERGYVGTYIACAPQKREEAIAGIRHVLERLAFKGPTASEMSRAKEFFLGRRAMDLQSDSSLAAHFGLEALYHVPHLSDAALLKKIEAVTAKNIREVCQRYLVEPYMVTSTVG